MLAKGLPARTNLLYSLSFGDSTNSSLCRQTPLRASAASGRLGRAENHWILKDPADRAKDQLTCAHLRTMKAGSLVMPAQRLA